MERRDDGAYYNLDIRAMSEAWKASANREGCKLVPINPSVNMLMAQDYIENSIIACEVYKAMVGAADE